MGLKKMFAGLFVMVAIYTLLIPKHQHVVGAPSSAIADGTHRTRNRPLVRLVPRVPSQYSKIKPDFTEFILDDDDLYEFSKRQASDDYGHLRFGKRGEEQFDDYGHMRFGRSNAD